jgi:hypothetical protein
MGVRSMKVHTLPRASTPRPVVAWGEEGAVAVAQEDGHEVGQLADLVGEHRPAAAGLPDRMRLFKELR